MVCFNVPYLCRFYGEWNREARIYHGFHADLVEACDWLRPRYDDYDAVFCTIDSMKLPSFVTLVALQYDAEQWFEDSYDIIKWEEFDIYVRYGKMNFLYSKTSRAAVKKAKDDPNVRRILYIVRPERIRNTNIVHKIYSPFGHELLWLCEDVKPAMDVQEMYRR